MPFAIDFSHYFINKFSRCGIKVNIHLEFLEKKKIPLELPYHMQVLGF